MSLSPALFSSATGEWETPDWLFGALDAEFGFDLDAAATAENAKCPRFYTKEDDGLTNPWVGTVFVNPPYGRGIGAWVEKAYDEAAGGATVVMLLPARTDTRWWHEWVMRATEIRFVRGRLKFGAAKNSAPFPSAVVVFRPGELGGPPRVSSLERHDA